MAHNSAEGPIHDGLAGFGPDRDPEETQEWCDSFDALVAEQGHERAQQIMRSLLTQARHHDLPLTELMNTDYVNTITAADQPAYPGDDKIESRIRQILRWNSALIVHRAQRPGIAVGGHISTYASIATMYEVGFNHFFRGKEHPGGGDQLFIQGHGSPGIYARAFLEGRLSENQLDGFRQESSHAGGGLPSYPHPRLMPDFWEFPTVSMGLGPMNAIYQAQFNKYLHNRGIKDTSQQHVWAFLGDGEMDEPESRGLLQVAAGENLDNLTFVVNCNLQRLDGPVRGNGKIIQELEAFFLGAGWNVIKTIWGQGWDQLLAADHDRSLISVMNSCLDGDYQRFRANDGAYIREHFFNRAPGAAALVKDWSDEDIWRRLQRGGHDHEKMFAAYHAATQHKGQPTVILAKTVKGYGVGSNFAGRNATHQMKKLTVDDLKEFRDGLNIPVTDAVLEANPYDAPYFHPGDKSEEVQYLLDKRSELGGSLPKRRTVVSTGIELPKDKTYDVVRKGSGTQEVATTMAFVRLLRDLLRAKDFGHRIVPIIPDEARTFGMDAFFPTVKIYNPNGQKYKAVDSDLMLSYKESPEGQIQHVGINEAGSVAAFTAAGTSHATHDQPMIPIYTFYSMFGFQRTADSFWAAADQMCRGFIMGATAGRTTLVAEGLQHADGHSPMLAATNPAVVTYDPAYAYEIGHIMRDGIDRMYGDGGIKPNRDRDVMYYITVYNEPIVQPAEPEGLDTEGLLRGMYLLSPGHENTGRPRVQLMASGVAVPWVLEAQELLGKDFGVDADVWSVTSWNELRRDGLAADETTFNRPEGKQKLPWVTKRLKKHAHGGPYIAVSDYMRAVPDQIAQYVPGDFTSLGTDGFGFSDTRPAARRHYQVDAHCVAYQALRRLAATGAIDDGVAAQAYKKYKLDDVTAGTSGNAGGDA